MNKENGKRALIITFVCAPARRVAVLRTEYPHFVRSVSPGGDEGAALDSQGGRVLSVNPSGASRHLPNWGRHPLDSRLGIAVSGTFAAKL